MEGGLRTQDGQKAQNIFTFQVEGEKLTGTVYSSFSGNDAKIEEGQVKGIRLRSRSRATSAGTTCAFATRAKSRETR